MMAKAKRLNLYHTVVDLTTNDLPSLEDMKRISYGGVNMNKDFQRELDAIGSENYCGIQLKKENDQYIEDETYRKELFNHINEMASCYGYTTEQWREDCEC